MKQPSKLPRYREETLKWCQEQGFEGDTLPRGRLNDSDSCPIARALHALVSSSDYCKLDEAGWALGFQEMPRGVRNFIFHFDLGHYKELITQ